MQVRDAAEKKQAWKGQAGRSKTGTGTGAGTGAASAARFGLVTVQWPRGIYRIDIDIDIGNGVAVGVYCE